jgi:cytochrome c oxidase cbb3-type subunit 3
MKNLPAKYISAVLSLLGPALMTAQTATATATRTNPNFWENAFGSMTLLGAAIVIAGALLAIVRLFGVIMKMEELRILKEKGLEEIVETYRQPQKSWWSRFTKSAWNAAPIEKEEEIVFAHDYDGIHELDNKLPPWWLWLFYVSIIFSGIYWGVYHVTGSAPLIKEEYEQSMEVAKAEVAAYVARQADAVDENSVTKLTDENELALGKSIFAANCVACHGNAGEGNTIGPNLTDEYWLHGGDIKDLFKTVKYGVVEKGMQSWKEQLRSSDIQRVTSYILSLQGSNPPNAKAPQGELWKGGGGAAALAGDSTGVAAPAADTTKAAAPAAEKK